MRYLQTEIERIRTNPELVTSEELSRLAVLAAQIQLELCQLLADKSKTEKKPRRDELNKP